MDTLPSLYNTLPTVEEANRRFADREQIFEELAPLLKSYDNKFGVCLVHAHCKLDSGEVMVANGDVSAPINVNEATHYPERWLVSGQAYEFTCEPTELPPPALMEAFAKIVGHIGVLGLYAAAARGYDSSKILLEHTEGRMNITNVVEATSLPSKGIIETAWMPGTEQPITMTCIFVCVQTDSGHQKPHDGSKA